MTESQPAPMGVNGGGRTYHRIAAALAKLQPALPPITRDQTATVRSDKGQYSYSYADLAAITRKIYPLLGEHGLAFTGGPTMNAQSRFVLRWMLLHESGEYIDGEYPLPADVKSPQALGSAITYGRRYCLCSAVGVVTDDDDGAAAEHAARDQAVVPPDPERADAVNRVASAWQEQFGPVDWKEVGALYSRWSNGKRSQDASPVELRRFAAYLSNLPKKDAGSDPADAATPSDPAPDEEAQQTEDAQPKITDAQRKALFAAMTELVGTDRQEQLAFCRRVLGRDLSSRSQIGRYDAARLIDELRKEGVTVG